MLKIILIKKKKRQHGLQIKFWELQKYIQIMVI